MRFAVMASGRGSNFQALIDARAGGELPGAELVQLIVNKRDAQAVAVPWPVASVTHEQRREAGEVARLQEAAVGEVHVPGGRIRGGRVRRVDHLRAAEEGRRGRVGGEAV